MRHETPVWAAVAAMVLATACQDSTSAAPGVALGAASRVVSLRDDSLAPVLDSVTVSPLGPAAATMPWLAVHGGGTWLTLLDSSGTGAGLLRWRRDPAILDFVAGTFVDTIRLSADSGRYTAALVDSLIVRVSPPMFITARRAWLPGERAATIAAIQQYQSFGALSDLAPLIYAATDSVTVVIRNPLYPASRTGGVSLAPAFDAAWNISGLFLHQVDITHPPQVATDTLDWLEVFWYDPSEPTWKGWTVADAPSGSVSNVKLNTTSFDASGGISGAGGGEARSSTGQYWEANGGTMTGSGSYGTPSTISSGQWTGGTAATGTMTGKLNKVNMPLVLPAPNKKLDQSFTFDFSKASIPAVQVICIFASPCTGAAAQAIAARMRAARSEGTPGLPRVMGVPPRPSGVARTRRSVRTARP